MYRSAYPAHPAHKGPGIAGVAAFQYFFQQPHHGSAAKRVFYFAAFYVGFYAQVPLYAGYRIYYNALTHNNRLLMSLLKTADAALRLPRNLLIYH
jgi:hypothetical protein